MDVLLRSPNPNGGGGGYSGPARWQRTARLFVGVAIYCATAPPATLLVATPLVAVPVAYCGAPLAGPPIPPSWNL